MYKKLNKVNIPNRRAKLLLELIVKLSIKKGFCYAGLDSISKIMCCSIRTVKYAIAYLKENDYISIEYRQRKHAYLIPNIRKIEQELIEIAHQDPNEILEVQNVDKSVDNTVNKPILDGQFLHFNTIISTIQKPCSKIQSSIGESGQPFLHKKLPNSQDSHSHPYSQNKQKPTANESKSTKVYAFSGLYKKVNLSASNTQYDTIANIVKFYNKCTENKLSYNTASKILRPHIDNGLTYEIAIVKIRDTMFRFKQKECDEKDLRLKRIFG